MVVQLLAFISLIAKIKKTHLLNLVILTQIEYGNYSSHFKYKVCLKIIGLTFFESELIPLIDITVNDYNLPCRLKGGGGT